MVALATWPPSSMAAGNKFSIVTTIPAHPAQLIGCKANALLVPREGIKLRLDRAGIRSNQLTGIKFSTPESDDIVVGINNVKPIALKTRATKNTAMGPF